MSTAPITRSQLQVHRQNHTKENSWWLNDAKGIPLCRVCDGCVEVAKSTYTTEVLGTRGRYEDVVEEQIEPDE
jgi:hypothetical protein